MRDGASSKQEEEKMGWDAVRKEYNWKVGKTRWKTKQEMQSALRKIVKSKEAACAAGAAASSSSRLLCAIELRASLFRWFADVWCYRSELTELGLVYE